MKTCARALFALVMVVSFIGFSVRSSQGQTRSPNIVVIVADDMGYADIGIHGSKDIPTRMMAIRKGHWKLLRSTELGPAEDPSVLKNLSGVELYNLKDDIGETKNIALLHPKIVRELTVAWQRWNKTLAKPAWPPIPIRPTSRSGRSN
jgi:hypothetical protein